MELVIRLKQVCYKLLKLLSSEVIPFSLSCFIFLPLRSYPERILQYLLNPDKTVIAVPRQSFPKLFMSSSKTSRGKDSTDTQSVKYQFLWVLNFGALQDSDVLSCRLFPILNHSQFDPLC